MPSRLPPRDCVSRSWRQLASARMRASLSRCVIARAMRGPDSREEGAIWESTWPKTQRADTARALPVALSYVASSLAEPRPRIRECLTPRARCVAPRDLGLLKPCSYSVVQLYRTGAKRGTYFVSRPTVYIRTPTDCILPVR